MAVTLSAQAAAPSYELRRQTLASLVKVRATDCPDGDQPPAALCWSAVSASSPRTTRLGPPPGGG